jgi:hypothetical protein
MWIAAHPYEADFSVIFTGPNLRSNACAGGCKSWWDEAKDAITPSARPDRATSNACSEGVPGILVNVGAELVVAEPSRPDYVEIVFRSRTGALNEQRRVAPTLLELTRFRGRFRYAAQLIPASSDGQDELEVRSSDRKRKPRDSTGLEFVRALGRRFS